MAEDTPKFEDTAPVDFEETLPIDESLSEDSEKMSKLEAAGRQAISAATLGASDIVGGIGAAAGQILADPFIHGKEPTLESALAAYKEGKQREVESREKAMEDQPAASVAGMLAGGLATPVPGAILAKTGKLGATAAKVLPSAKGAEKIVKAGKLAKEAKVLGKIDLYNKLKKAQLAKSLSMAAKEGAKAGAITGLTTGESSLLEGDVKGTIKDAVKGGTLGAAAAAGLVGGTHVTGSIIRSVPGVQDAIDSFSLGLKGVSLEEDVVNKKISDAAKKYVSSLHARLNKLGKEKHKIMDLIDEQGITINVKSDLDEARKLVKSIDSQTERKRAQQFLDVLEDYLGDGKATKNAIARLEKEIIKGKTKDPYTAAKTKLEKDALKRSIESSDDIIESQTLAVRGKQVLPEGDDAIEAAVRQDTVAKIDPETGEEVIDTIIKAQPYSRPNPSKIQRSIDEATGREIVSAKDLTTGQVKTIVTEVPSSLDAEKLTTGQTKRLADMMKTYSALAKKESLPKEVTDAATRASMAIKDKLSGAAKQIKQPLDEVNKKITNALDATDIMGMNTKAMLEKDKLANIKNMAKYISGVSDKNPVSDKGQVMTYLRRVDPKFAKQMDLEIAELRKAHQLHKPADHVPESASFRSLMGTAGGIINKLTNAVGRAAVSPKQAVTTRLPGQKSLAGKTLDIVESSPEQIQRVITRLKEGGEGVNQTFIAPLQKALKSPQRTKNAIMYGLMQQPAFREMLETMSEEEEK